MGKLDSIIIRSHLRKAQLHLCHLSHYIRIFSTSLPDSFDQASQELAIASICGGISPLLSYLDQFLRGFFASQSLALKELIYDLEDLISFDSNSHSKRVAIDKILSSTVREMPSRDFGYLFDEYGSFINSVEGWLGAEKGESGWGTDDFDIQQEEIVQHNAQEQENIFKVEKNKKKVGWNEDVQVAEESDVEKDSLEKFELYYYKSRLRLVEFPKRLDGCDKWSYIAMATPQEGVVANYVGKVFRISFKDLSYKELKYSGGYISDLMYSKALQSYFIYSFPIIQILPLSSNTFKKLNIHLSLDNLALRFSEFEGQMMLNNIISALLYPKAYLMDFSTSIKLTTLLRMNEHLIYSEFINSTLYMLVTSRGRIILLNSSSTTISELDLNPMTTVSTACLSRTSRSIAICTSPSATTPGVLFLISITFTPAPSLNLSIPFALSSSSIISSICFGRFEGIDREVIWGYQESGALRCFAPHPKEDDDDLTNSIYEIKDVVLHQQQYQGPGRVVWEDGAGVYCVGNRGNVFMVKC